MMEKNYGQKDKLNSIFYQIRWLLFITKPFDVNIGKVGKLRQEMPTTNSESLCSCIKKLILKEKHCKFEFCKIIVSDKPPCIDNLDGMLLRMVADSIATPICLIFNLSQEESICPQAWREAKVIPLPKSGKAVFTGSNSRPISLLPALSKLLERIVFDQCRVFGYAGLSDMTCYSIKSFLCN